MVKSFEDLQQVGKENVDVAVKTFGAVSTKAQEIAVEVADYSKKAFEESTAAFEKLLGVKSFDKAIEVQTDYAKSAYEAFVSQANKLSSLYADLAKETYKPFETLVAKAKIN
ncbi:MAG TPA: phasin family protein [Pseudolabrys sp.]|nr:phasin family protein [Pseudolabrys sp.]